MVLIIKQLPNNPILMGCCLSKPAKNGNTQQTNPPEKSLSLSKPTSPAHVRDERFSSTSKPPPPPPKKRALLCGVSYRNSKYELGGTINDINNMRLLLINHFGFLEHNMLILTEEKEDGNAIPTKKNIEKGLKWLVEGCGAGDSLVFYFAGHGSFQLDRNRDERDGFDETICPLDFLECGQILDNYINSTIVRPLKKGVTLHAIVDACHSGTILDLSHIYNINTKQWEDNSPPSGARKGTDGGLAISISACEDNQEALNTFEGKGTNGAMTYILTDLMKERPGLTYGDLLDLMHETIEDAKKDRCLHTTVILKKLFGNKISQTPQLSSSEIFDVYERHFQM